MSKFQVALTTGAFAYITVEADSEEEAIEEAFQHTPSICAQCSGWGQEGVSMEVGHDWELGEDEYAVLPASQGARVANG